MQNDSPYPPSPWLVVVDTNIVTKEFELTSADWNELFKFQEKGHLRIFIPEVVVGETIRHHGANRRHEIKSAIDGLGSSHKMLLELGMADLPEIDLRSLRKKRDEMEDPRDAVDGKFRALLHQKDMTVLPVPDANMATVFERYMKRRKPYKDDGEGFADDLIWRTIVDLAESEITASGTNIAFITKNSKDFAGAQKKLHEDLAEDLSGRCEVKLYLGARAFLEAHRSDFGEIRRPDPAHNAPADSDSDEVVSKIVLESVLSLAVTAARGFTERDLPYQELDNPLEGDRGTGFDLDGYDLPSVLHNPYIQWIELDEESAIWNPYEEMDGTEFGRLEMEGEAFIEGYVMKSDLHVVDDLDSMNLVDGDHNDHMATVGIVRRMDIEFHIRAETGEAEVLNLESLAVVPG
uniref:PIN domain-containing protein n=1 Tax=Arthrobacter sp. TaxID=1667 RepID=UPI000EB6E660|nr:PIN domain-containing protein [Arthrobacter sp.]AXV46409.1 DUF4935 domain-containing protein [Arthrobacter sp.]